MGMMLVYDVTDESSFNNIRSWIANVKQHASGDTNKILVGNQAVMEESKRVVPTARGQALADEYGIKFFETVIKFRYILTLLKFYQNTMTDYNVEQVFFSIAKDIMQRLAETDSRTEVKTINTSKPDPAHAHGSVAEKSERCSSLPSEWQDCYIIQPNVSGVSNTQSSFQIRKTNR